MNHWHNCPAWLLGFALVLQVCPAFSQWNNIYTESSWEERDQWQNAPAIMKAMRIGTGSVVADIGSHEGYMTMKLAALVGAEGKVYAVELDRYKLRKLEAHAAEQGLRNIETVLGDEDDPRLPAGRFDAILLLDTYHEIEAYVAVLEKFFLALRPGGRLVLVEPISDQRRGLSRKRQAEKHELEMKFALQDLIDARFQIKQKCRPLY